MKKRKSKSIEIQLDQSKNQQKRIENAIDENLYDVLGIDKNANFKIPEILVIMNFQKMARNQKDLNQFRI